MLASELVNRLQSVIKTIGDREILVDDKEINSILDVTDGTIRYYNMQTIRKPWKPPM